MTHTIQKCRHGRTVHRCRCRGPHNVEIVPCVSAECLKEVEMKTDKSKIDLDEFEARMALIEAAEPAGNQRVHVQTWKLRAMIRAIRAAIAERDHGDMDPFGMSKLTELRAALQPFREGRTSMSAPRRDFAKCCGVQDHPLCKTCDRFLRPPDAVSQMWAIPRPFEHVEQDGSVRRGCRDYVEVRA